MLNRFLECNSLMKNFKQSDMGIDNNFWCRAMIDLDCVGHFWAASELENCTVLCDACGDTIFIIDVPYARFKKHFMAFHAQIFNAENN